MQETPSRAPVLYAFVGLVIALIAGAAGWMLAVHGPAPSTAPTGRGDVAGLDRQIHDYIVNHPEVLDEAVAKLREREAAKQLSTVSGAIDTPFPGAVMGNPQGKVTLVEFTDFACTFCRQSVKDVDALIAANPDLRVLIRELPILTPESTDAARWALAAAEQGRYEAFHHAMYAIGRPDARTIEAAAQQAGLDMERARRVVTEPRVTQEINANLQIARQLGFTGTPSWVVGDTILQGAVGQIELARAITAARG